MTTDIIDTIGCIILRDNKILLGKRFKNVYCYADVWDVITGHVENETPEETTIREMKEELRIDIIKLKGLGSFIDLDETSGKKFKHIWFLAEQWKGEPENKGELEKIEWFTLEEVRKLKMPKQDKEFIIKFMNGVNK